MSTLRTVCRRKRAFWLTGSVAEVPRTVAIPAWVSRATAVSIWASFATFPFAPAIDTVANSPTAGVVSKVRGPTPASGTTICAWPMIGNHGFFTTNHTNQTNKMKEIRIAKNSVTAQLVVCNSFLFV